MFPGSERTGKPNGPYLLKPSPRQLRRVGADGNHSRTNVAEERQVLVDFEKLPDAMNAVVAVVEDQNHRPAAPQFAQVPDFALGIGEFEVGCLPAQERVVMGRNDIGMGQDLLERSGRGGNLVSEQVVPGWPRRLFLRACEGGGRDRVRTTKRSPAASRTSRKAMQAGPNLNRRP